MSPPDLSATALAQWVVYLYALATLIPALEYLRIRDEFSDEGYYSWKIFRLSSKSWHNSNVISKIGHVVFGQRGSVALIALRVASAIFILALPLWSWMHWVALGTSACLLCIFSWRQQYGEDGADQMTLIVGITCFLCFGPFQSQVVVQIGLWFIALQSALAYFSAGVAKLISPVWRSGLAVGLILDTATYGSNRLGFLLVNHPLLGRLVTWGVVSFETVFPIAFILPWPGVLAFLLAGVLFHAGTAIAMGLNNFVWAFLSTYPAILYVTLQIHS